MNHIIGGNQMDLRAQTTERLEHLVELAVERRERAEEEIDSLMGELIRRRPGTHTKRHLTIIGGGEPA